MNDLQRRLAQMTEDERYRLLNWLALNHPDAVVRGLVRPSAHLENAAITWRINQPAEDPVPPADHPGELAVPDRDGERTSERVTCTTQGGTQ